MRLEPDEHAADLAVWPSQSAARQAVKRYQAGGPATRPVGTESQVVRRVDRIRNVTLVWYNRPNGGDEAAFAEVLHFSGTGGGAGDYTGIWAIPGALIDPRSADANAAANASYSARLVLAGGCVARESWGPDLTVAIWPSRYAAEQEFKSYKELGVAEHYDLTRNATLVWQYPPNDADEATVKNALHS